MPRKEDPVADALQADREQMLLNLGYYAALRRIQAMFDLDPMAELWLTHQISKTLAGQWVLSALEISQEEFIELSQNSPNIIIKF